MFHNASKHASYECTSMHHCEITPFGITWVTKSRSSVQAQAPASWNYTRLCLGRASELANRKIWNIPKAVSLSKVKKENQTKNCHIHFEMAWIMAFLVTKIYILGGTLIEELGFKWFFKLVYRRIRSNCRRQFIPYNSSTISYVF